MKRHTITEGATTTTGGKVIGASSHGFIDGLRIALENDPVQCPVCNSIGHIFCVGPRLNERWNGVQVALENDLCVCNCYPHSRLIACQTKRYQVVSDHDDETNIIGQCETSSQTGTEKVIAEQKESYDQHFHIKNESGQPLADFPYVIELSSGRRIEGKTDQDGKTAKILASGVEQATLFVYAPEITPINPTWDR